MKSIDLFAISIMHAFCCLSCTPNNEAQQDSELDHNYEQQVIPVDTNPTPSTDTGNVIKFSDVTKLAKESGLPTSYPKKNQGEKDARRFVRMTQRIADSLRVTPGAILRLHPEDSILLRSHILNRPVLSPRRDPKTGDYLPFPYAYPQRYATDIRRLDSIKAADSLRRQK